jgi:hypothetical protein
MYSRGGTNYGVIEIRLPQSKQQDFQPSRLRCCMCKSSSDLAGLAVKPFTTGLADNCGNKRMTSQRRSFQMNHNDILTCMGSIWGKAELS